MDWFSTTTVFLRLSVGFTAGAIGAIANTLMLYFLFGIKWGELIGVKSDPFAALTPAFFYDRITWGAIWGMLYAISFLDNKVHFLIRGVMAGLVVSIANWLIFLPLHGDGLFGSHNSPWFWTVVLFNNLAWGLASSAWYTFLQRRHFDPNSPYFIIQEKVYNPINDTNNYQTY